MIFVNVIYDECYEDVDIIAIPKTIEPLVDNCKLSSECSNWVYYHAPKDDSDYWRERDGRVYCNLDTNGFIKWLNNTWCGQIEAYILEEHVKYNPNLKRIDF